MKRVALGLIGITIMCQTTNKNMYNVFTSTEPVVYGDGCIYFTTTDKQVFKNCEVPCLIDATERPKQEGKYEVDRSDRTTKKSGG